MSSLIALYSPVPQSGKTEFAKIAQEHFGYISVPFAEPVKAMLYELLINFYDAAMVDKMLYGELKGHTLLDIGRTPRELMVTLGTDWGRNLVHPGIWVMAWRKQVQALLDDGHKVIVDDMRFPNEFKAVTDLGGFTINIERPYGAEKSNKVEGQLNGAEFNMTMFNTRDLADWNRYCAEVLGFYEKVNHG